jgi:hypothetical protein
MADDTEPDKMNSEPIRGDRGHRETRGDLNITLHGELGTILERIARAGKTGYKLRSAPRPRGCQCRSWPGVSCTRPGMTKESQRLLV